MPKIQHPLFLITFIIIVKSAAALYGYDCGELTNITTISLVDVGDCNIEKPRLNVTKITAQLIQVNDFSETQVISCSIKITRHIKRCGMLSHNSEVTNGKIPIFKDLTKEECKNLYLSGIYIIGNTHIHSIQRNGTTQHPINLAGSTDNKGNCEGTSYADLYGKWDNVIVTGWVEITLRDYYAPINLETNKIMLRSGLTCSLTSSSCNDYDGSNIFWEVTPETSCGEKSYSVLYEGWMEKAYDPANKKTVFRLQAKDIAFALLKTGEHKTCGTTLTRTEHPRLFIIENTGENTFIEKKPINARNLDLFTYVNSKFVYLEKFIETQLTDMYYNILQQKCELERKVLTNALAIATISPEEFGYRIMEETGYLGVVMGEVIHLIKCVKVPLTQRLTNECYDQLPVHLGEEKYFLSPRTRILVRTGKQIHCDPRLPAMYNLGNVWIKMLPAGYKADTPEILKPQNKPTWTYHSLESIAIGGIYGEKDIKRLRDMILFPMEKESVLNRVALGMSGRTINNNGISITQFIDKETLEAIAESTWKNLWGKFLTFGTASAGIIGLFLTFRLIKLLVDTIIHGYAIYSLYGFSVHLMGAFLNSVTQLLLHLGHTKDRKNEKEEVQNEQEKTERGEIPEKEMSITNRENITAPTNERTINYLYPNIHPRDSI